MDGLIALDFALLLCVLWWNHRDTLAALKRIEEHLAALQTKMGRR